MTAHHLSWVAHHANSLETLDRIVRDDIGSEKDGPTKVVLGPLAEMFELGLREILGEDPGIQIVAAKLGGRALELAVAQHAPDVVVLDEAYLHQTRMFVRLRVIRQSIRFVVLTHGARTMRVDAHGQNVYVSKDASTYYIRAAIRGTVGELRVLDKARLLTPREKEVAKHMKSGLTYAAIGRVLSISVETVKTHAASIRRKLGVDSRWDLFGLPPFDPDADDDNDDESL